jgi:hypothetical protein
MKENYRIRFNPVTKEIEIEGSEGFVKAYFNKIQAMILGSPKERAKESKVAKARPAKNAKKEPKAVKVLPSKAAVKDTKKVPGEKRVTNINMVVGLIQDNAEGISTSELTEKTGLAERQIWGIVNRASKAGKIRKVKRGVYGGVAAS